MNNIETMKLALEAFGEIAWSNETEWQRDRAKQAITALRQAINASEPHKPLTDEQCDEAIRRSGLWTLACIVPQNLAMLRGLCREAAHGIKGEA